MKNYYELKQTTLDKLEIEGLIERIKKLEKELGLKELEIRQLNNKLRQTVQQD